MLVVLFICVFVVGIPLDLLQIWMKMRVNEALSEDRRLSWWSWNYRQVERIYGEQHPDNPLPDLSRYGGYLVLALFGLLLLVGLSLRK